MKFDSLHFRSIIVPFMLRSTRFFKTKRNKLIHENAPFNIVCMAEVVLALVVKVVG